MKKKSPTAPHEIKAELLSVEIIDDGKPSPQDEKNRKYERRMENCTLIIILAAFVLVFAVIFGIVWLGGACIVIIGATILVRAVFRDRLEDPEGKDIFLI